MINKIYNEDCLEGMKKLSDKSVDVVFTSPPYNRKRNDKYSNYTDIVVDWFEWQIKCIDECLRVSKNHVFYNIQTNYYNRQDVYKIIGHYHNKIKDIFIWEKTNPMPASGFSITNAVEYFIVFGDTSLKSNKTYTKNFISTSVNNETMKEHRAIMKKEVAEHFISLFSKEGDIVLDPFMGVGTTAIVSTKLNRNYIGFEISKDYCKIADKRIHDLMVTLA